MESFIEIAIALLGVGFLLWAIVKGITLLLLRQHEASEEIEVFEIERILASIPYYKRLSDQGQQKFSKRTRAFIENKNFVGMEGLEVTSQMKVWIASTAVQLTYGLDEYSLDNYDRINIYPDTFFSRRINREVKGLTFVSSAISLSWPHFKEGVEITTDKLNLGLHELAHALKAEVDYTTQADERFEAYLHYWEEVATPDYQNMKDDKTKHFLRKYAGTNRQEFFAVCVEHFFEAPVQFKAEMPDVYYHLCFLLNQDPLEDQNDYQLSETFREEANKIVRTKPIPRWIFLDFELSPLTIVPWFLSLFLTVLPALMALYGLWYVTVITFSEISMLVVIVSTLIASLRYKKYKNRLVIDFGLKVVFYRFLVPGIYVVVGALVLNYLIPISKPTIEEHTITHVYRVEKDQFIITLSDDAYSDHPLLLTFRTNPYSHKGNANDHAIYFQFNTGIMGFKVMKNYYFDKLDAMIDH